MSAYYELTKSSFVFASIDLHKIINSNKSFPRKGIYSNSHKILPSDLELTLDQSPGKSPDQNQESLGVADFRQPDSIRRALHSFRSPQSRHSLHCNANRKILSFLTLLITVNFTVQDGHHDLP